MFTWILILFYLPHSVLTWRYPPAARRLFTALCGAFIMSLVVDFNILLFIMGKFLIHHFHTFFLIFPFISHVTSFNHVLMQCMNYMPTQMFRYMHFVTIRFSFICIWINICPSVCFSVTLQFVDDILKNNCNYVMKILFQGFLWLYDNCYIF